MTIFQKLIFYLVACCLPLGCFLITKFSPLENLCRHGIAGLSHCVLCLSQEETSQHMFVECKYTKEVWSLVLADIEHKFDWHIAYSDLFSQWRRTYQGSFHQKTSFKRIWKSLPEYISWCIWLSQNKYIFQNEMRFPKQVATKSISLLS
jgi:hypothetical protein